MTDWTFIDSLPDAVLPDAPIVPIEPDGAYVEMFVESLRLKQARRFGTGFHGLVYIFARLSQEGAEDAELAAVSKPAKLAELNAANLDPRNYRLRAYDGRGALAWRDATS
jgi:hypothetical protein